jgi:hypothetical protein
MAGHGVESRSLHVQSRAKRLRRNRRRPTVQRRRRDRRRHRHHQPRCRRSRSTPLQRWQGNKQIRSRSASCPFHRDPPDRPPARSRPKRTTQMNSTHPGRDTLVEVTDQTVATSNQAAVAASPSRNRTAHQVSALKLWTSDCAKDSNIPREPHPTTGHPSRPAARPATLSQASTRRAGCQECR